MKKKNNAEINRLIGERVRWARKEAKKTQEELSEELGFKDRQILANIEAGSRKVSADELLVLIASLGKPLDYFTDPYLIVEENIFSWRADPTFDAIADYELKSRKLVGAYRRFADLLGEKTIPIVPTIPVTARSTFEQARASAEALVAYLNLGEVPAARLQVVAERELGINVMFIDVPDGISGAACHLADLNMILINRHDSICRRNFDMAHEIFHLLTWEKDKMRPESVDASTAKRSRIEMLADNFAGALLMPTAALAKRWENTSAQEIHVRINDTAKHFQVSSLAAYYRLKNLGWLEDLSGIDEALLKWHADESVPPLYSKTFAEMLYEVLRKGLVSARKAASLLDMTLEDIDDVLSDYGYKTLDEMEDGST